MQAVAAARRVMNECGFIRGCSHAVLISNWLTVWLFPVAVSPAIPLADGYSVVSLSCYATANDNLRSYYYNFLADVQFDFACF